MERMAQVIERIACVGAGVIGASWATNFILKGYPVTLFDIKDEFLQKAKDRIYSNLVFLKDKDIIDAESLNDIIELAGFTTSLADAVKDVQLIQESGPEDYVVKQKLLGEIEEYADKMAIYASSTSGLLITEITKFAKYPERCLGVHPYNPPHLIPLVEMSKGEKTSEETLQSAYNFYKALGKEPVILQKEVLGFIANRLQAVLYREAADLVMRGVCSVEDVDKTCLYGPGLRYGILGPNLIFQLGGGAQGIKGMMEHLVGPSFELWLVDAANWTKMPEEWPDIAQQGVDQEMLNRSADQGRTSEEILQYRDDMLIKLLKLHQKL
jgi:3-hydroxyacyl-CoA dehydrogenase